MKKLILLALGAASLSAYALPTYEPFTEFAATLATSGTNLVVTSNGVSIGTNANAALTNVLDLATNGFTAPSGEQWGSLTFSGAAGAAGTSLHGIDIAVISNTAIFTQANLSSLLPATFPGMPAVGQSITNFAENCAQPLIWTPSSTNYAAQNYVGNSAVLKFASDVTRPASGLRTLYVSYLYTLDSSSQLATGNNGRFLTFLAQSNLVEGLNSGGAFTNWNNLFNTFNTTSNKYCGHGLLADGSSAYLGALDSSTGKDFSTSPNVLTYATPAFVVGAYVFNGNGGKDTNLLWMNPATNIFGGPTPPATGVSVDTMAFNMSDIGGIVLEDRPGNGASGGVGTNYVANLLIGSTWSFVTGGPEFTTQPISSALVVIGGSTNFGAIATAAAQTVSYQWQKIVGNVTNNLTDGTGTAGGTATVTGSLTTNLSLVNVSSGDLGTYQCLATASGTTFTLASSQVSLISDPEITSEPQNATANYGQAANFTCTITTAKPSLTYQWYIGPVGSGTPLTNGTQTDGSVVSGASGTTGTGTNTLTLTVSNVSYQDSVTFNANNTFYVFATNNVNNSVTSDNATLTVNDPYIVTEPANPAVAAGGNATFTVVAAGSPTINYQWYENGSQLNNGGTTATGLATVGGATSATLTLTNVQDADDGNYTCTISDSASSQTTNTTAAVLVVQDALTIVGTVQSWTERVGDHLAFTVNVHGGGPSFQWAFNSTNIAGATNNALVLTNIHTTNQGTYSVTVSNLLTSPTSASGTLTVINSSFLNLEQTNVIVVRVGDGSQTLSATTGNTIYLDQYTTNGTYVDTVQIPDQNTGQVYGTGSTQSSVGSPALLVEGAGSDAAVEGFLTVSGGNQEYIDLAGYCEAYPYHGTGNVNEDLNAATDWRGLSTVNAFGVYTLAYTNMGLYSGGNELIHGMVTLDGTNFWVTGEAGSDGLKYVNGGPGGASYAQGNGVPGLTSSAAGTMVAEIFNSGCGNNLVFSDQSGASGAGIYLVQGLPEPGPDNNIFAINEGGKPTDFAISPDAKTVYIADSQTFTGTNAQAGGIQRWDTNTAGAGYIYSYTLPADPTTNNLGGQGLTVNFGANATWGSGVTGAVLFVTTSSGGTNTLSQVVDNGPGATPTLIATAGANQALRGVRFGPAAVPVSILAQSASTETAFIGNNLTLNVTASGSLPLYYQWQINGTNISSATNSSLSFTNLQTSNAATYTVIVTNLVPSSATNTPIALTVISGSPSFSVPSYVETVGDHLSFAPVVSGSPPFSYLWTFNGTNYSTNPTITLTNIQTSNSGTYVLTVSNSISVVSNSGTLTVTTNLQALIASNLVVVRVGDGVQPLSPATGNTMYLDQYTTAGGYVSTIQIPDEGLGQTYGTGSSSSASMPFGSQALLIAGDSVTGSDADYEGLITRSGNGYALDLVGYVQGYPFSGTDVTTSTGNGGTDWRGIGEINVLGAYSTVWTNTGLCSGGNHFVHTAATEDQFNYWVTGEAGAGLAVKYVNLGFQPANGLNLSAAAGTFQGPRVVQVVSSNVIFSDVGNAGNGTCAIGLWIIPGGLTGAAISNNAANPATLLVPEDNSPVDFAFSPDLKTVYIADNGAFVSTSTPQGGIQRWDTNTVSGGYSYSYTLSTGRGSTVGARGVTADFSANATWGSGVTGAKVYATTAEASGNRLLIITDSGIGSGAARLLTAGATNTLAGVRFAPVAEPVSIVSQPENQIAVTGTGATFTVGAVGLGPLYYQWQFNGTNLSGATGASVSVSPAQAALVGGYTVIVSNSVNTVTSSPAATISFVPVLGFYTNGEGWSSNAVGSGIPAYNYGNSSNAVELTQGVASQGSSTFYNYPFYVGGFLATWTYQVVSPPSTTADGTVFVLQNDARGAEALGGVGGDLGYGTPNPFPTNNAISNSFGLQFNIYPSSLGGVGYAFDTNGTIGSNTAPGTVVLNNGDPINVSLEYLDGVATLTLEDPITTNSYSTNLQISIPDAVGGDTAYIGFTAGDGASVSTQVVSNFVYIPLIDLAVAHSGGNVLLSWPAPVGGYVLQQIGNVASTNWLNATNAVSVVGQSNQVTVAVSTNQQYYRLVLP